MALYDPAKTNVHDLKEVKDTLFQLSERVRYYFKALSIEDNFSPEEYLRYKQTGAQISAMELSCDGLISNYEDLEKETRSQIQAMYGSISLSVTKGDVSNQLSLEPEALKITGNRLEIYGNNIALDEKNNLVIRGEIKATDGSIAGWTIGVNELVGSTSSKITCSSMSAGDHIWMDDIVVNGDSSFAGCQAEFSKTNIETDRDTIFLNGFTAETFDTYGYVIAGPTRVYESCDVTGQVTCKKCVTIKDHSTWSDLRLKENIREIAEDEADSVLKAIVPYKYRFKNDNKLSCGFMAQHVKAAEEAIGHDYGLISEGKTLSLSYTRLLPFLIKTIQRQAREIDELSG